MEVYDFFVLPMLYFLGKPKIPPPASGKAYLLEKMLTSTNATSESADSMSKSASAAVEGSSALKSLATEPKVRFIDDTSPTTPVETLNVQEITNKRDSDACSDAGTYVVDRDDEELIAARLKIDQVFIYFLLARRIFRILEAQKLKKD